MSPFEQEIILAFQPSAVAIETAAHAQWDYEVAQLTDNTLARWDTLDAFSREQQRANIRLTLTVAYAAEAPRLAAAIEVALRADGVHPGAYEAVLRELRGAALRGTPP